MGKKLLLADDSVTIQKVIEITFADKDYQLQIADNGDQALSMAQQDCPDLILADVFMPGKDGYELCEALRAVPELASVPVLLLAGTFEPFDESKANAVGATDWIAKPFSSQELVDKVAEMLSNAPAQDTWKATPGQTPVESDLLGALEEISAKQAETPVVEAPAQPEALETPIAEPEPLPDFDMGQPAATQEELAPAQEDDSFSFDAVTEYAPPAGEKVEEEATTDLPPLSEFSFETNETPPAQTDEAETPVDPFALPEAEEAPADEPVAETSEQSLSSLDPFAAAEETSTVEEPEVAAKDPFADLPPLGDFSEPEEEQAVEAAPSFEPLQPLEPQEEPEPELAPVADLPPLVEPVAEQPAAAAPAGVMDLGADAIVAEGAYGATPKRVETRVAYLSDEQLTEIVERVAGAVIEKLASPILEKVVWEVVPDLAESLVREEMDKIKPEA
ncbi:PleD family two-component system response regulator [Desulfuromonas acetoxidans]|uniref:Response regulator receiver protein n=1 Tax=Desulfuromonas acetoxidans (strain DSM 684 / 11070) TaxID=281689 RepID=Q1JZ33_DESA6|nr:response regulator [Desulfuromonas acetoxidans]EAT15461.1 response regulator receiver protein [Desulfuromonas acetoxidans DSM 684]MBF0646984.1 response regulator [Desulfuromonas acetoxidans]NVD25885.1 response regulator [Desulfuromonas acetoxidans]NVE17819.1 response regulator [Desulfuromonas acetoxidans]